MNARNNVVLSFNSDLGKIVRLNIPRADASLTEPRARAAMEDIIAGGIIVTTNGTPNAIHGAELVATHREPLVSA